MKVSIQVANRDEANMIVAGLADPQVFALVKIAGALSAFPPRVQQRMLRWVEARLNDPVEAADAAAKLNSPADAAPIETGNGGEPRLPGRPA